MRDYDSWLWSMIMIHAYDSWLWFMIMIYDYGFIYDYVSWLWFTIVMYVLWFSASIIEVQIIEPMPEAALIAYQKYVKWFLPFPYGILPSDEEQQNYAFGVQQSIFFLLAQGWSKITSITQHSY